MKKIDKLINRIIETKSPLVVGLDPLLDKIPLCYKKHFCNSLNDFEDIEELLFSFNKDIIDAVCDYVPAVKPQIAFYEAYGINGLKAFERTIKYAKENNLVVIEDGKRNDISSTALAYANGHLGQSKMLNNTYSEVFDVDFLTVTPYLGSDGLDPFVDACRNYDKGIFVLVKTSNPSSSEIQNARVSTGEFVYEYVARCVYELGNSIVGDFGYSSLGAVVGATYPSEASKIRKIMQNNFFLVPGYGTQGGDAKSIVPCFNSDGLGAIVNSSRGILYSYEKSYDSQNITRDMYIDSVRNTVKSINKDIVSELRKVYKNMIY